MEEFFGLKFVLSKYSALDGLTTITLQENSGNGNPFTAVASQRGIHFHGRLSRDITSNEELQDFARLIAEIWKHHRKLVPKITTSFQDEG